MEQITIEKKEATIDVNRQLIIDKAEEKYKQYQEDEEALNYYLMKELVDLVPKLVGITKEQQHQMELQKEELEESLTAREWLTDELGRTMECLNEIRCPENN